MESPFSSRPKWDRVGQNRSDQSRENEFCIPRFINIVDGNRNDETQEKGQSDLNLIKQPSPSSLAKYFYETRFKSGTEEKHVPLYPHNIHGVNTAAGWIFNATTPVSHPPCPHVSDTNDTLLLYKYDIMQSASIAPSDTDNVAYTKYTDTAMTPVKPAAEVTRTNERNFNEKAGNNDTNVVNMYSDSSDVYFTCPVNQLCCSVRNQDQRHSAGPRNIKSILKTPTPPKHHDTSPYVTLALADLSITDTTLSQTHPRQLTVGRRRRLSRKRFVLRPFLADFKKFGRYPHISSLIQTWERSSRASRR